VSAAEKAQTEEDYSTPEITVRRFFNAIFGHTRKWPHAFSCLAPEGRAQFGSEKALMSFADYWEEKLLFLEEFVKKRHREFPYTHRTCFSPDKIRLDECSGTNATVAVELVENHLAREPLVINQTKHLTKHGRSWLLTSGELEGNLGDIVRIRKRRNGAHTKNA